MKAADEELREIVALAPVPTGLDRWRRLQGTPARGRRMSRRLGVLILGLTAVGGTGAVVGLVATRHAIPGPVRPSPTAVTPRVTATTVGSQAPLHASLPATATASVPTPPPLPAHTAVPPPAPAAPGPPSTPSPAVTNDVGDAYVDSANPGTNYGSAGQLFAASNPALRHTYVRFSVSGTGGHVASAHLRIYLAQAGQGFTVHAMTDSTWTEGAITYANAPGYAAAGVTVNSPTVGWQDIVVPGIGGDGTYNFVITSATANTFASRETLTAPQLVIH